MNLAGNPLLVLATCLAGALAALLVVELARNAGALGAWLTVEIEPLTRTLTEGRIPTFAEKARLAIILGAIATASGWFLGGPVLGLVALSATPVLTVIGLAKAGLRFRREVERAMPDVARAVADGLSAGRTPRAALISVADTLEGEAGSEFGRIGRQLASGLPTDEVADRFAGRFDSDRIDAFVVAITSHGKTGGDLASLLRRYAEGAAESDRVVDDARTSTAQARFSGYLVCAMPLLGIVLAEFASPGIFGSVIDSPAALLIVGLSLGLQVVGFIAISRLAAVADR